MELKEKLTIVMSKRRFARGGIVRPVEGFEELDSTLFTQDSLASESPGSGLVYLFFKYLHVDRKSSNGFFEHRFALQVALSHHGAPTLASTINR